MLSLNKQQCTNGSNHSSAEKKNFILRRFLDKSKGLQRQATGSSCQDQSKSNSLLNIFLISVGPFFFISAASVHHNRCSSAQFYPLSQGFRCDTMHSSNCLSLDVQIDILSKYAVGADLDAISVEFGVDNATVMHTVNNHEQILAQVYTSYCNKSSEMAPKTDPFPGGFETTSVNHSMIGRTKAVKKVSFLRKITGLF